MDAKKEPKSELFEELPTVPLRDVVVFPHMIIPFVVGRRASVKALEEAMSGSKRIFLATQFDAKADNPSPEEVYSVGVIANILQSLKLPNGNVKVLVEGVERARVMEWRVDPAYMRVVVKVIRREGTKSPAAIAGKAAAGTAAKPAAAGAAAKPAAATAETQRLVQLFEQYVKLNPELPYESMVSTLHIDDPAKLSDTVAAHARLPIDKKQNLLETFSPGERVAALLGLLEAEIEKLQVDRRIQSRVKRQMEKAQKEYYLSEKMKAIQSELGRKDDRSYEIEELQKKVKEAKMPKEVEEKAVQELKRLEAMPPVSAEATVSRNYLEWLIAVPWWKKTRELRDIGKAEAILDEDHHGLEKIKERILEFLAVRQLVPNQKGSILCFVGPPGVGKTSLAKSIARATGRKFVRLSLGGVRDEAEVRGHRRTYIGAFPGQIIQMMKKAGSRNPVFLLDEVDKLSSDFRGDPSSALLEVLDPEQNDKFVDHYLDVEYDLSQVMFIATANMLHPIPPALQDRMEVIRLPGYTMREKLVIAERFLVPKQLKNHGLEPVHLTFTSDGIRDVIEGYTREAGVRNLEREIASICRKVARRVVKEGKGLRLTLGADDVNTFLGVPKFRVSKGEEKSEIGVATGLAWTEVGGEILTIEISLLKGRGKLTLTGKLGDVMQESAQAAFSYARRKLQEYDLDKDFYRQHDIHVHIPEGAIPKDGPSAGITMATALISAFLRIPVRKDLAMTGEVTLRGRVLPIGGLKEKVLAAHRAGILRLLVPADNRKDWDEVPKEVRDVMTVSFVEHMEQVLELALDRTPVAEAGIVADLPAGGEAPPEVIGEPAPRTGPVPANLETH